MVILATFLLVTLFSSCEYVRHNSEDYCDLYRVAVLVFLWLVAMVIGALFKRFMMGAKGWEQIPFLDCYKAFGNLEAVCDHHVKPLYIVLSLDLYI